MKRADDYAVRRAHLANLSDQELKDRFWELAGKLVDPLIELAHKNTSPSIERSVLLRMGFDSIESNAIVTGCIDRGLLGKGAGHVVVKLAELKGIDYKDAGRMLIEGKGFDDVISAFKGGAN